MAVVKNHFETTLSDTSVTTHSITGLTSETSTTNVNYVSQEASLYFLRSIHQTLLDAGYNDVVKNELEYSISVFGFKFFIFISAYNNSINRYGFELYTYGLNNALSQRGKNSSNLQYEILNDYHTNGTTLSFNLILRGNENCIQLGCSSYNCPNAEYPLIFLAKAKSLITSEEAFCYTSYFYDNVAIYIYIQDKNNLYNYVSGIANGNYNGHYFETYYTNNGLNTASKFICEPVLGNYGTYLIYSLLKCNNKNFERGKYYKIGSDIYFCYGYKEKTSDHYDGSYLLFKVS